MKPYIEYLPPFYEEIKDIKAIGDVIDEFFRVALEDIGIVRNDFFIDTASAQRLDYWERILGIISDGRTQEQRRNLIKARMQGGGKLNEEKIAAIVRNFTGGSADISFENSTITVKIAPPDNAEEFRQQDVIFALSPLIPAHLQLSVIRFFDTWETRKDNYQSWNAIKSSFESWHDVKFNVEEL